jgi:type VI secretion system protein ImpA
MSDASAAAPVDSPWDLPEPESETGAPGEPRPPDTYELAMQAARSGRAQEGIEMLMRELGQERSGRGRFNRKVQLSQLCVSVGHDMIALPMLQELAAEIERRKLEDWETPDLVARPLALLFQCLGKQGDMEQRGKLYSWICRLDPLMALSVSR